MTQNDRPIKRSIVRRTSRLLVLLIVMILLGGGALFATDQVLRSSYESKIDLYDKKSDLAIQIQLNMNGAVTELRGYMAMRLPQFKDNLTQKKQATEQAIAQFRALPDLTADEATYLNQVETAKNHYFNDLVPQGIALSDAGNTAELTRLGTEGNYIQFTDSFRKMNVDFVNEIRKETKQMRTDYNQALNLLFLWFTVYLVLVGLVGAFFVVRFARNIGRPLQVLAANSARFEEGKLERLGLQERQDEIGYLAGSLLTMFQQIQQNERRLIEQNDELQAQQEELISQQDELYTALLKMQENERVLEAQNLLNTSLVNTLDRDELLQSIIKNVAVIQQADKAAIVLMEPGYPYASVGVKQEQMEQFLLSFEDGMFTRMWEERKQFVVSRLAKPAEKGYHEEAIEMHDLYVPILSYKGEIVALVVLTRMGRTFTAEALGQAQALANQISLSIEKLRTYQESERSRVLNQEIIDSIREGIQLFDEYGRLIQVNKTWCILMQGGCNEQERSTLTTSKLFELFAETVEEPKELIDFIQQALVGSLAEDQKLVYQLKGEEKKVIQVYYEKISDHLGQERGTVLVHRDMTREYEVDQMKSEFVSTVSHELRTPLSSVLGFTELMLNKELKPERQKKYLDTIHKEAKRLTQLINDFLDIQRMEAGRQLYEMRDVNVLPILEEVVETFALSSPKHQLKVDTKLRTAMVRGDETKLRQVFTNLIGNSVKYSPEGGEVAVEIREKGSQLLIDIRDEGLGIPKEAIGKLFSKFYRIDNSDRRKIGGTGLGLAICKEIMKAHEGSISVQSELGQGSTFRLHFPLPVSVAATASGAPAETTPQEQAGSQPRLLIVEDDNSLAMLLQEELKESGFQVVHVTDGGTALHMIREQLPDAIVLDIMLKDSISGWVVIEELKKDEHTASIPIFISSALDEKEKGMSLGANGYLTKPYQPNKLSNLILHTLLRKEKTGVIMIPEQEK